MDINRPKKLAGFVYGEPLYDNHERLPGGIPVLEGSWSGPLFPPPPIPPEQIDVEPRPVPPKGFDEYEEVKVPMVTRVVEAGE